MVTAGGTAGSKEGGPRLGGQWKTGPMSRPHRGLTRILRGVTAYELSQANSLQSVSL